jgi:integrase
VIGDRRDPVLLRTDEDITALIAACPNEMHALVRTLPLTGMRLEETASLERRQVDFARKAITLERIKLATLAPCRCRHRLSAHSERYQCASVPVRVLARRG